MGMVDSCCGRSQNPEIIELVKQKLDSNLRIYLVTCRQNLEEVPNFITPQFYLLDLTSNENKKLVQEILQEWQSIKQFISLNQLRQFKDDHKNNLLLVCVQSDTFLNQMLPNSKAFQRIAFVHFMEIEDLDIQQQKLKSMYGYRFAGFFQTQRRNMLDFLSTQNISRSIYLCDKDCGFINKALSIIYFFLDRNVEHSFQFFRQYLQAQGNQGKVLKLEIQKLLNQKVKLGQLLMKKVAEQNKILISAIDLLKQTFNPGIIAHVSWFYDALHSYIRKQYHEMLPTLQISQVFIVAELRDLEIISIAANGNFMFSTFVVGYTSLSEAQAAKDKYSNSFVFIVNLPKNTLNKNLPKQDFGFCVVGSRVIFTVQTFFKIDKIKKKQKEILVTYGILGKQFKFRRQDLRYLKNAQPSNMNMLKYFDYLAYNKFFIKTEADLLLHLQFYHKYKQQPQSSLTSFNSVLNLPERNSQINLTNISNRSQFLPTLINDEKAADVQFSLWNIQAAQNSYNSVLPADRGMIKKLYMYDRCSKKEQFSETIEKMREVQITDEFANRFLKIALMSYNAVMLAQKGQQKQAEKKVKESIDKLNEEFKAKFVKKENLHEVSVCSFPLYSILLCNGAKTAKTFGQNALAEMYQNDYKANWPFFDGTHINWLP